jgi:hypothetical protein
VLFYIVNQQSPVSFGQLLQIVWVKRPCLCPVSRLLAVPVYEYQSGFDIVECCQPAKFIARDPRADSLERSGHQQGLFLPMKFQKRLSRQIVRQLEHEMPA